MDTARLTELVKMQKKNEASKSVKREFHDNWLQYIREVGPGEEAFRYLVEGFTFCGMEPFAEYLRSVEDLQKTVIAFLHSPAFSKNSAAANKCGLNLLACLLRDRETEYSACACIMRELPQYAFTKEKQMIKELGKIYSRNLFAVIYAKKALPAIMNYGLNKRDMNQFVLVTRKALEQCQAAQMSENEIMGARLVSAWIDEREPLAPPSSEGPGDSVQKPASAAVTVSSAGVVPSIAPAAVERPASAEVTGPAQEDVGWGALYSGGIQSLKAAFDRMQQEMLKLSSENKGFAVEREKLQSEIDKKAEQTEFMKKELEDREERLFAKGKEVELLQTEVARLKQELELKTGELNDRIEMSQIVRMDSERQTDQEMKRLASELSTFYRDIMESDGISMSSELGEILRDQIKDVFGVLIKHGIRVDQ